MKYEIITDSEDTIVLVANSRVIMISRYMSRILDKIEEDYPKFKNKTRKDPEKVIYATEEPEKEDIPVKKSNEVADENSLGKLLRL